MAAGWPLSGQLVLAIALAAAFARVHPRIVRLLPMGHDSVVSAPSPHRQQTVTMIPVADDTRPDAIAEAVCSVYPAQV